MPSPAVLGVAAYVIGLGLPVGWRLPLLLLGISLVLQVAWVAGARRAAASSSAASWIVVAFAASFAGSVVVSADVARSAQLALALLPGLLALVALREARLDADALGVVGAAAWVTTCIAGAAIIGTAMLHPHDSPFALAAHAGLAAIVVPNDAVLLAVLAPASLSLLEARTLAKRIAGGVGLALTVLAIGLLASRIAFLTLIVALGCHLWLLQPRRAVAAVALLVAVMLAVDGARGWAMLAKLAHPVDPRLSLWAVEWRLFTEAPLFGHGPFTLAAEYEPTLARLSLPAWLTRDPQATVPWAHSLWFEALGERGLVGLATLALLFGSALRAAYRRAWQATPAADPWRRVPMAALAALLFASFFELTLLHEWVGVVLFGSWAIVHAADLDQPTGGS